MTAADRQRLTHHSLQLLSELKPYTIKRVLIPFLLAEFVKSVPPANDEKAMQHVDGNLIHEVRSRYHPHTQQ